MCRNVEGQARGSDQRRFTGNQASDEQNHPRAPVSGARKIDRGCFEGRHSKDKNQVDTPTRNQRSMLVLLQENATTTVQETVNEGVINAAGFVVLVAGLLLVVAWLAYLYR